MASTVHTASTSGVGNASIYGAATAWTDAHVAHIACAPIPEAPILTAKDVHRFNPDLDFWDMWPLQNRDGKTAHIAGGTLWMALSAPIFPDPGQRHAAARIRLLHQKQNDWRDCGPCLPDGLNPGSREWSGSAILAEDGVSIMLYFTAAGRTGDAGASYEQRIFQASGLLDLSATLPKITHWSLATECVVSDGTTYIAVNQREGEPGAIKAFRDPYWFCDPADQQAYIVFTASLAQSQSAFNGAVGIARAGSADGLQEFALLPPLLHADGVNNELERPHIVMQNGLY
jgi:levansucrase